MDTSTLVSAASYAGLGVVALARPTLIPQVMGGSADNYTARSEVRAVYGGMPLAAAALLATSPGSRRSIGVITASFAAGRVFSSVVEKRAPDLTNAILLACEGALAVSLLRRRCP